MSRNVLEPVLEDSATLGYRVAAFSGGEPLLHSDLPGILRFAKVLGLHTIVTSNGLLLDEERMERLIGCTDMLAISLDGMPESHNYMRASSDAFERMQANLPRLRQSGIPWGFVFTLTQYNVKELHWVAHFALEQGARSLQIQPLEETGRASQLLVESRPDDIELTFAGILAEGLRQVHGERLLVQVEASHPERVKRSAAARDARPVSAKFADLVTPLVVETNGNVVPLGYGFAPRFGLGSVIEYRLKDLAAGWMRLHYPAFQQFCYQFSSGSAAPAIWPVLNYHETPELAMGKAVGA